MALAPLKAHQQHLYMKYCGSVARIVYQHQCWIQNLIEWYQSHNLATSGVNKSMCWLVQNGVLFRKFVTNKGLQQRNTKNTLMLPLRGYWKAKALNRDQWTMTASANSHIIQNLLFDLISILVQWREEYFRVYCIVHAKTTWNVSRYFV